MATAPKGVEVVDVKRLRCALKTLNMHRAVLARAAKASLPPFLLEREAAPDATIKAIEHVLDGYRSDETQGG